MHVIIKNSIMFYLNLLINTSHSFTGTEKTTIAFYKQVFTESDGEQNLRTIPHGPCIWSSR